MAGLFNKDEKTAVILFNLGGPDSLKAVRPFLYNLFSDPAIIQIPTPFRQLLAAFISTRREPIAQEIYNEIGGKSPILEETLSQQKLLQEKLLQKGNYKVFTVMRYWHPFAIDVAKEVKNFNPDKIILLPLYPQFSTTTTQSSFKDWEKAAKKTGLQCETKYCCCYGEDEKFIQAHVEAIKDIYRDAEKLGPTRILFSAHGLPQKIIDKGDPYEKQINSSADKILSGLKKELGKDTIDSVVCYQSKVGPLKWLSPSLDDEIERAVKDNVGIIIVPIAFVSEHSETLVELDIEYKKQADELNIPHYFRVPTLSNNEMFISCLVDMVEQTNNNEDKILCEGDSCYG